MLKSIPLSRPLEMELRESIGRGKTLSRLVLQAVSAFDQVEIAVPEGFDTAAVLSLRFGGIFAHTGSRALLLGLAEQYLRGGAGRAILFEDYLARADDAVLREACDDWATLDGEVYHLLVGQMVSRQRIDAALRRAYDPVHTLGVLTEKVADLPGAPRRLARSDLEAAVANAAAVIVGVCDGESFLRIPLAPRQR